ncbi:fibronectin type-III domain-containing protein 3A isoform X2 [Drosophila grimshawi]|uniref:fibronectin type-III domain-containing protein 3A isoform X2 n=1 Tax=Drosophila grimshawi TaxID=7222 RepID=UPI000C86F03F|nr:fibronectin type-III domain-containing protein 3A isoform X2 [Drosophila grimshawi]
MVRLNVAEQQSTVSSNSNSNSSNNNINNNGGNSSNSHNTESSNNAGSCSSTTSSTTSLNSLNANSASPACNIVMLQNNTPVPAASQWQQQQQQQQHQQPQLQPQQLQQHTPLDGASLPASPPLLQQTATPPQGAQIVPPVCALHHPQQQLTLLAAMQHHHHHMLQPPNNHGLHHGPNPPAATQAALPPQQQQQQQQTSQPHENGHGGISPNGSSGGGSSASSVSSVSSNSGGGLSGGSHGNNSSNGTNGIGPPVNAPLPPPGPLYIQYPGEYFPSEYYIAPHPHEGICPQHPHHPHAHQHHHQPMCAISAEYGPAAVQMVSHNRPPPTMTVPVPVQVPPYVHENGTLTHVVLPPQQYQQLHPGQGHLHATPFISSNGTSHFYTPLPSYSPGPGPAGNGPPHYHMPPQPQPPQQQQQPGVQQQQQQSTATSGVGGAPSSHLHSPHSPSPPNYRDERSQRQHTKLLRKLEKQREQNSSMSTPTHSPSPRRSDLNGHFNSNNNNSNNNIPMQQHQHNNNNHMHNHGRRLPPHQQQQHQQQQQQQQQQHVRQTVNVPSTTTGQQQVQQVAATTQRTGSSVGTSEDGEDTSSLAAEDDEDYQALIVDQISAIDKPDVIDVSSRTAKIIWVPPAMSDELLVQDLRYQVLLSDTGKQCKYKSLYLGEAYECIVQVHYQQLQGSVSEPTEFKTPACEPDQPLPPKLVSRTKSSINLRWTAPASNGAPIQHYLLEYDVGRGNALQFVELAKIKAKHYVLNKLQSTTVYSFRLAAVNEVGQSVYSQVSSYSTAGNPPTVPMAPQLQACGASSLRLVWERRPQDGDFLLQLQDADTGHGYLNSYKGGDTHYECQQLRRATSYQFRLRAENDAGVSPWSPEVSYSTVAERPGRPGKPHVKGKIHGTHFKARWEPPSDNGGCDALRYHLELSMGASFERIYSGSETEAMCDRLQPGVTYQLRACCEGSAGESAFSDIGHVTTEAVPPGAPPAPQCDAPPTPYAVRLRLSQPEYNGGAPVLEFEAQLRHLEISEQTLPLATQSVYRGQQDCFVAQQLQPGGIYEVQARAINRIGAGSWSQWLRFTAAAAPPGAAEALQALVKSATHLSINWQPPMLLNGSPVTGYTLQNASQPLDEPPVEPLGTQFHGCYQGSQTNVELRNLTPYTRYYLRVLASNAAGTGPPTDVVCVSTPSAVPGAPQMQGYEFTHQVVTLNWTQPAAHGSPICSYNIEYGERTIATPDACTRYTVLGLTPETSYKFRVQAVNAMGSGPFSAYAKLTTQPSPPAPPRLECSGSGHNYIKLKWGETGKTAPNGTTGGNSGNSGGPVPGTKYHVEMYVARAKQFQAVYSGTNCMCKIHKLQERSSYTFRIYAHTDRAGDGEYSEEYIFETSATLPANIKAPRVMHESGVCVLDRANQPAMQLTLEWQHSKNSFQDRVEYELQYAVVASDADASNSPKGRSSSGSSNNAAAAAAAPVALSNQDYRQLYRGTETKFTIDNLAAGTCYQFRVCPVRVTAAGDLFHGQSSVALRYQVPSNLDVSSAVAVRQHLLHGASAAPTHATQRSSRKLSSSNGSSASGLHLRSVSASAISGSSGVGADAQAISRLQHELSASSFKSCADPRHHHHHHHHHHQHPGCAAEAAASASSLATLPASSTLLLRGNHMHHQHLHHSHHMHHAHYRHPSAAAGAGILPGTSNSSNSIMSSGSNGNCSSNMPHGNIVRRIVAKLTALYCNRKRLTDQQKAVFFVVSFVFVTFLVAMLVHMLCG